MTPGLGAVTQAVFTCHLARSVDLLFVAPWSSLHTYGFIQEHVRGGTYLSAGFEALTVGVRCHIHSSVRLMCSSRFPASCDNIVK